MTISQKPLVSMVFFFKYFSVLRDKYNRHSLFIYHPAMILLHHSRKAKYNLYLAFLIIVIWTYCVSTVTFFELTILSTLIFTSGILTLEANTSCNQKYGIWCGTDVLGSHTTIINILYTVDIILSRPNFNLFFFNYILGGGPRVVVSTAAFQARVRGSVPGLGGFKETKMFLPHPCVEVSIVGSLRDRVVACSASDRQGSNFEFCVWRTVSSQSSHHPQEVLLAQFSLYVHKGGLKPDSFHFISITN